MGDNFLGEVGWLGAGRMGSVLIRRLLAVGTDVTVYNRTKARAEPLVADGAKIADAAAELARADVVFVMVGTSQDLLDAVLGPACDSGWWAIGLHNADPRVFVGVPMSTSGTCAHQRARLAGLGLRTAPLPELRDVDTFADAHEVALATPGSRFARTFASLGSVERIEDAV